MIEEKYFAVVIVLWATAFDAWRDAVVYRWKWWPRHIVKWLAFYPPLVYIVFVLELNWLEWLAIGTLALMFWRGVYEIFQDEKSKSSSRYRG